jgi:phosphomannomutase
MVVLELMGLANAPLSTLVAPFDRYAVSGELNTTVRNPAASVAAIAAQLAESGASIDLLDGLTADFGDWWFNLRPSNTEPLLRLNVEDSNAASLDEHVAWVRSLIAAVEA